MKNFYFALTLVLCSLSTVGCNPRIKVLKSPKPHQSGIRYYRPKPYLLVSPYGTKVVDTDTDSTKVKTTTTSSDEYISLELQYLPDFSEEYALDVKSGLGSAEVSFTLKDGWMLTEVNQKLDSQFDENLTAVAELVKAATPLVKPTGGTPGEQKEIEVTHKWVVAATNVPLGYYESVISQGPCGKALSGWRYVGFAPFNSCPTTFCGTDSVSCNDPLNGPVYGLAFANGVMTFRRLDVLQELPDNPTRVIVPTGEIKKTTVLLGNATAQSIVEDALGKMELIQDGMPVVFSVSADDDSVTCSTQSVLTDGIKKELKSKINEALKKQFKDQTFDIQILDKQTAAVPAVSLNSPVGL